TTSTIVHQLFHCPPGVQEDGVFVVDYISVLVSRILIKAGFEGARGVNEIKIDVIESQPFQTAIERRTDTFRPVIGIPNLRRHEQVVPANVFAGESNEQSFTDLPLVAVTFGAIEVTKSCLQRVAGSDLRC